MAAPGSQQTVTGHGESALTTTAPPAYREKEALGEGQAPMQQLAQPGGQLPQAQYPHGQYPTQAGGALPQIWPQGYLMPQAVGQTPTVVATPSPGHPAPHNFLMLALVTTIICGILNLLSLSFGIPAIVLAALSMSAKNSKNYPQAKRYGRNALILTIFNIIFTMILSLLIVGLVAGYGCADPYRSYRYRYYYYYSRYLGRCNGYI